MNTKTKYLWFSLIVILNIILKAWNSDYTPYSYDEIISVKDTLLDFGHIKHESEWDNNPPFYYYCLWVWHKIIPISEFNSRLLSVLFVSISIGLSFLFASKRFNFKTAIVTVLFLSVSNFITYYAQETRTYSLVILLSLISSILFFKYLENGGTMNLFAVAFVNFLIIYSHYIAGLIILMQYIVIILFYKSEIKKFINANTLLIITLVWLRFTKKQFLNILNYNKKDDFWLQPAGYKDLIHTISDLFFNPITTSVFILFFFVYLLFLKKNRNSPTFIAEFYCLLLGFVAIFLLFGIGTVKSLFLGRYLIFCIPFATMLVSYRIMQFNKVGIYILSTLICYSIFTCNVIKESGMDYKSIAEIAKLNKRENDIVIINTRDNIGLFEFYFDKEKFFKYKKIDSICKSQNVYGINDVEQLNQLDIKSGSLIFLAQSFHTINASENRVELFLSENMKKIYSTNGFKGVEFNIYKKY